MRIIAGVAKGRALGALGGATRPTSDRAREGVFSSVTSEFGGFHGLHVLDLFAGSGAIGLEALSRGATLVHAVEQDWQVQETIALNSELVSKSSPSGKFQSYVTSAQKFLSDSAHTQYHFVYIDPPYDFPDTELEDLLAKLHAGSFLKSGAFIAVERRRKGLQFTWPAPYETVRQRRYALATIYYANYQPDFKGENG